MGAGDADETVRVADQRGVPRDREPPAKGGACGWDELDRLGPTAVRELCGASASSSRWEASFGRAGSAWWGAGTSAASFRSSLDTADAELAPRCAEAGGGAVTNAAGARIMADSVPYLPPSCHATARRGRGKKSPLLRICTGFGPPGDDERRPVPFELPESLETVTFVAATTLAVSARGHRVAASSWC